MRATVLYGAGDVRIENVPDARVIESTDALVTVSRACICGSDLWPYKLMKPGEPPRRMGHEAIGVVEAVGSGVRTLKVGDVVVMPFAYSDGTCAFCHEGLHTSCVHGGFFGTVELPGAQAEALRIPLADGTLFALPVGADDALMASLLTLSDVMGTGHHAARAAKVARGESAIERVRELTGGFGVHSVLECVGTEEAMRTAIGIARAGGAIGRVGVPHYEAIPGSEPAFYNNLTVGGGPAPVRAYIQELLPDVLEGKIEPGRLFDRVIVLDDVPDGYRAMNQREAIKVMVKP